MRCLTINHVYCHVPFCLRKCNYCSFYSICDLNKINPWYELVKKEIRSIPKQYQISPKTIYFGGGTPSLVKPNLLQNIINCFDAGLSTEITIEVNPVNINSDYLNQLQDTSVNRISMGVQSFQDQELELLGRLHSAKMAIDAFDLLRKYNFQNLSLDLIFGLPNQSLHNLKDNLKRMIDLSPEHISVYCLSLENDVPLYNKIDLIPSNDILSKMYFLIRDTLQDAGYLHYEISNFTRKGFQSIHNSAYWQDKYYLGLGPSASGYLDDFRYNNPSNLDEYAENLKHNNLFPNKQLMTKDIHKSEYVFLGLRQLRGLNISEYKQRFNESIDVKFGKVIRKYLDLNLLILDKGFLKLSPKALFVSNEIFTDFV